MCDPVSKEGCTEFRRQVRTKENVYECSPPPPVVVQCSVCHNAEREGCNLWSYVPFLSYTSLCGPTLGDILVHILNLLPLSVISWLGVGHEKTCGNPSPPVTCYEPNNGNPNVKKTKKGCPEIVCREKNNRGEGDKTDDNLSAWMREEYMAVAQALSHIRRMTRDPDPNDPGDENRDLLYARNYVLDRQAEMLAKREEIERRMKKKKQKDSG